MGFFGGGNSSNQTTATTNNYDQRSILTQTLDGGAIAGALGFAQAIGGGALGLAGAVLAGNTELASKSIDASGAATVHAYDYADNLFSRSVEFADKNAAGTASAYEHAAATQTAALGLVQNAYADSKGTSKAQQQMILAVLAVAAIAVYSARA